MSLLFLRVRASTHYRSELTPDERATKLTEVLAKVSAMVQDVIQASNSLCTSSSSTDVSPPVMFRLICLQ